MSDPHPPPFAIQCRGLSRRIGSVAAVQNLDLNVPAHGIYGFLGPNGAGKTTTIRLILGLIRPDQGQVRIFGDAVVAGRGHVRVGALVEAPSLYDHLSGRDNLEVTRRLVGVEARHIDRVLAIVGLEDAARRRAGEYSLGMRQRLGLALALLTEPDLLVLDEPTNGLDPAGIHEMRRLIAELSHEHGMTIFLSSHHLSEIEQVADHIGIVQGGQLRFEGSLQALQEHRQAYLELGIDRPQDAAEVLGSRGWTLRPSPGNRLIAAPPTEGEADVPALNRVLVEKGLRVHHLRLCEPSLESLFLHMTGTEGP